MKSWLAAGLSPGSSATPVRRDGGILPRECLAALLPGWAVASSHWLNQRGPPEHLAVVQPRLGFGAPELESYGCVAI